MRAGAPQPILPGDLLAMAGGAGRTEPDTPQAQALRAHEERLTNALRTHFKTVWRALRRFGVPAEAADDAAQEVFIVAARRLDGVPPGNELRFLYGVALRVAANARRAQKTRRERADEDALFAAASDLPPSDALLEEKRMRQVLYLLLDRMSDDLRTAFVLFELEGLSLLEIAELCEIPLGTVSSRLRRARAAFRESVGQFRRAQQSKGTP